MNRTPPASLETVLARADAAVESLGASYAERLSAQVAAISALVSQLSDGDGDDALGRIYVLAFEMKGEAGSFGYGIVSRAAASLCRLVEKRPPLTPALCAVLKAHADGLHAFAASLSRGDGDQTARAVAAALEAVSDRFSGLSLISS